jgi:3-hydroxyacyl-CoA dehydrogenase
VPVTLFDLTADAARQGLDRLKLRGRSPSSPDGRRLIRLPASTIWRLAHADWIIEAVIEDLSQAGSFGRVAGTRPRAPCCRRTRPRSIRAIAEAAPALRNRVLGTHFSTRRDTSSVE